MKPGGPVLRCPGPHIPTIAACWFATGLILGALFGYILRALE